MNHSPFIATSLCLIAMMTALVGCTTTQQTAQPSPAALTGEVTLKGGPPVALTSDAEALRQRFGQALADERWADAVACCDDDIRAEAARYASNEVFLRTFVPIDKLGALEQAGVASYRSTRESPTSYKLFVEVREASNEPSIEWAWQLVESNGKWEISFGVDMPLDEYIQQETDRRQLAVPSRERDLAWATARLQGLTTRITPFSYEFAVGSPMRFKIELVNRTDSTLRYYDSQVALDGSMLIVREGSGEVFIDTSSGNGFKTEADLRQVGPGESAVLIEGFDISAHYDLTKPGTYRATFKGAGLDIGVVNAEREPGISSVVTVYGSWPSNEVTFKVVETDDIRVRMYR